MTAVAYWLALWNALLDDAPRLGMVVGLYAIGTVLEHHFPAEAGQGLRGRLLNLAYGAIFVIAGLAALCAMVGAHPVALPWNARVTGLGSALVALGVTLFARDFLYYWYHRAQHRFPLLWSIHELHHADASLNVTTSFRTYWLEMPVQFLVVSLPPFLLIGADPTSMALIPFVSTAVLLFTHANLRLRLGPLTAVLCGPQLHRIHHSNLEQHRDRNFAQTFPILDVMFGTYCAPGRDEFPTTGTPDLASDAPIGVAMLRPLRLAAAALAPRPPTASTPRRARRRSAPARKR